MVLPASVHGSRSQESGGLAHSSNGTVFCWGMCNYGGQAFDPGFPSGLNCPHIERRRVSLGAPLYSAALSCAPLWNSKHLLLKSELWPVHAPVQWWNTATFVCVCVCMRANKQTIATGKMTFSMKMQS